MGDKSTIEWTDATWNPVRGCSIVSKGCTNCYAMKQAHRSSGAGGAYEGLTKLTKGGPVWTGEVRTVYDLLSLPLEWRRSRRIFVNSMSDLFHENVPQDFIWRVLAIAALCPQHTFQVLTKRATRMQQIVLANESDALSKLCEALGSMLDGGWIWGEGKKSRRRIERAISATMGLDHDKDDNEIQIDMTPWPLPNVWLGVSVEDQATAEERIPLLLQTPAAVRWISAEPLLGPIDLEKLQVPGTTAGLNALFSGTRLGWVVAGGESGHGARAMEVSWARAMRDQCKATGVPFFLKQWGNWLPAGQDGSPTHEPQILNCSDHALHTTKKAAGRQLDGRTHDEYPQGNDQPGEQP